MLMSRRGFSVPRLKFIQTLDGLVISKKGSGFFRSLSKVFRAKNVQCSGKGRSRLQILDAAVFSSRLSMIRLKPEFLSRSKREFPFADHHPIGLFCL